MAAVMIAFGGKGGSGKTTAAALLIRELIGTGNKPVLAVDADPNATLAMALGVESGETISDLRDRMGEAAQAPSEIPKDRLMDQWLAELISEQAGFDLLTMGRPEGPKCYCYVNGLLRRYLSLLRDNYPVVVVDCEAGMEYLSRLTIDGVDTLVLVAEASAVGVATAERIAALSMSLPIKVGRRVLAMNKTCADRQMPPVRRVPHIDAVIDIPWDQRVAECWEVGEAIEVQSPQTNKAIEELARFCLAPALAGNGAD